MLRLDLIDRAVELKLGRFFKRIGFKPPKIPEGKTGEGQVENHIHLFPDFGLARNARIVIGVLVSIFVLGQMPLMMSLMENSLAQSGMATGAVNSILGVMPTMIVLTAFMALVGAFLL